MKRNWLYREFLMDSRSYCERFFQTGSSLAAREQDKDKEEKRQKILTRQLDEITVLEAFIYRIEPDLVHKAWQGDRIYHEIGKK
ncbi:unnamed protein product [Nesidiocoris tenuis]|uniref:Uncharacterized protein n=1 Tax=Nesidiocoris tenuis TaxID=355587 RepID=A0A6H5GGG5_9HEMI|nr:unnamed protein product [Nesidiocoris tenuis]